MDDIDHWILLRRNLAVLALDRYRRLAEPGRFLGDFVKFFSRCQDELVTPEDYERHTECLAEAYAREKNGLAEDERASARNPLPSSGRSRAPIERAIACFASATC